MKDRKLNFWPIYPLLLQCKTKNGCHNVVCWSIMLKVVLVAHLTSKNQWLKWHTKIQTFVFLDGPAVQWHYWCIFLIIWAYRRLKNNTLGVHQMPFIVGESFRKGSLNPFWPSSPWPHTSWSTRWRTCFHTSVYSAGLKRTIRTKYKQWLRYHRKVSPLLGL